MSFLIAAKVFLVHGVGLDLASWSGRTFKELEVGSTRLGQKLKATKKMPDHFFERPKAKAPKAFTAVTGKPGSKAAYPSPSAQNYYAWAGEFMLMKWAVENKTRDCNKAWYASFLGLGAVFRFKADPEKLYLSIDHVGFQVVMCLAIISVQLESGKGEYFDIRPVKTLEDVLFKVVIDPVGVEVLPCEFRSPLHISFSSPGDYIGAVRLCRIAEAQEWLPMMTASAIDCFGALPVGTLHEAVADILQEEDGVPHDLFQCCERLLREYVDPAFPETEEGLSVLRKRLRQQQDDNGDGHFLQSKVFRAAIPKDLEKTFQEDARPRSALSVCGPAAMPRISHHRHRHRL